MRTVLLNKGSHRYLFRYNEGGECDVLEAIAELAGNAGNNFDWLDAATLSFQVASQQAASCIEAISSPPQ